MVRPVRPARPGATAPTRRGGADMAIPALVTLAQAKAHLRITTSDGDADLQLKLDAAQVHVLLWCSTTPRSKAIAEAWTAETVPPVVHAAILLKVGELDRRRGDDLEGAPRREDEPLLVDIHELLRAYHDVGVA